jgi:TolB-like protein
MPSLIHGYEYDIFISYRQKDNKGDRWVSEFVETLKTELESTFKEEISVYFDINPHDGLLETHDVDASLKDKLKCLIFIPIISRTYCDPKSFAWEHEFKAFIEQASKDQFGLKVKLPNGNVASRVLPVRIHDLDNDDMKLCELVLGGVLRGVEFIYKEPGVDRPLTTTDDERKNLNSTKYRNQLNKVALAIKDIITALKKHKQQDREVQKDSVKTKHENPENLKARIIIASILIPALILLGYLFIPRLIKSSRPLEKSIAVLPFINDSPVDSNRYFINGIMEEVLNNLQRIKDLRVISRTSVEQFRNTPKSIPEIAKELGVNYIVEGSGQKYGSIFSLRVQLIKAAKENHLWAESYEQEIKNVNDICNIQKRIAQKIARELKAVITPREENLMQQKPTNDTLAYDYYLKGKQSFIDLKYDLAIEMYSKAIKLDPGFALALLERSAIYSKIYFSRGKEYDYSGDWQGYNGLAKEDLEKALKINPELPEIRLVQALQLYTVERKHEKALELLNEVETQMFNNSSFFLLRGAILRRMGKWEESIRDFSRKILLDPLHASGYIELGHTYRLIRKYPEALEYLNKSLLLDLNPENIGGKFITLLLWKGNLEEAFNIPELKNVDNMFYGTSIIYYFNRQYDKLLNVATSYEDQFDYIPKSLNSALACLLNANIPLCRQYADSAITELTVKIIESPYDERYYSALGYAYAYKGENKKAIENAQKAVKLKPLKLDAWQGFDKELDLVQIYILTGEYDNAMDRIEFLLTIPGDLSVQLMKVDPAYDKLRNLPRFQKILMTEFKTNY